MKRQSDCQIPERVNGLVGISQFGESELTKKGISEGSCLREPQPNPKVLVIVVVGVVV